MEVEMIFEKIKTLCDTQKQFPYIHLFDERNKKCTEFVHHDKFEKICRSESWRQHIRFQENQMYLFIEQGQRYFIFSGLYGLIYCLRPVYLHEKKIASLILGGYRLANANDSISVEVKGLPQKFYQEIVGDFEEMNAAIGDVFREIDTVFLDIVKTLKSDMTKKYSLSDLEKIHYCHSKKISRLFLKHTKMSFGKFYQKLRMEYALEQMEGLEVSIADVAESVGYSDERAFRRALKEYLGK